MSAVNNMADDLVKSRNAEEGAVVYDRVAQELQANATLITEQAVQAANSASLRAAKDRSLQLMQQIEDLEGKAEKAEVQAAALRAKAHSELQSASLATLAAQRALGFPAPAPALPGSAPAPALSQVTP